MIPVSPHVRGGTLGIAGIGNDCLAALSAGALTLLQPHLSEVNLGENFVLWDGDEYPYTLFPVSGLVSITVRFATGECIEVAAVGKEGAAAQFTLGPAHNVTQGYAFTGGNFLRIPTAPLLAAAESNEEITRLIHFCREWMMTQSQQIAACNAVHSAEQRLCRWLLQCCQRLHTKSLHATQDGIASALGIRRTTVTLLAQSLQAKGVIQYRRGRLSVTDLAQLEEMGCECCTMLGRKHWPSSRLREKDLTGADDR